MRQWHTFFFACTPHVTFCRSLWSTLVLQIPLKFTNSLYIHLSSPIETDIPTEKLPSFFFLTINFIIDPVNFCIYANVLNCYKIFSTCTEFAGLFLSNFFPFGIPGAIDLNYIQHDQIFIDSNRIAIADNRQRSGCWSESSNASARTNGWLRRTGRESRTRKTIPDQSNYTNR